MSKPSKHDTIKYEYEFRHGPISKQGCWVAVNTHHYGHGLDFALFLRKKLRQAIPFKFRQTGYAKMEVLGGNRVSGMMSIELYIKFKISDKEAEAALKKAKFWDRLEYTR